VAQPSHRVAVRSSGPAALGEPGLPRQRPPLPSTRLPSCAARCKVPQGLSTGAMNWARTRSV